MDRRGFAALTIASLASLVGIFTLTLEGSPDGRGMFLKAKYADDIPDGATVVTEDDRRLANSDVLVSFINDVKIRLRETDPQSDRRQHGSVIMETSISDSEYSNIIDVMESVAPDRRPGTGIFVTTGKSTFEIVMVGED
jgi:hypothetical protein